VDGSSQRDKRSQYDTGDEPCPAGWRY